MNTNKSEGAFLFSTFMEFCKCWRSGARTRVTMESMNGRAFVNFSAFLGHPDNDHFQPRPSNRNPTKLPRKKSKIKRDNDRAARFQELKRKEAASASKPVDNPEAIATSSPSSESEMTTSGIDSSLEPQFSFASPVPEIVRHDKINNSESSMILSDIEEQKQDHMSSSDDDDVGSFFDSQEIQEEEIDNSPDKQDPQDNSLNHVETRSNKEKVLPKQEQDNEVNDDEKEIISQLHKLATDNIHKIGGHNFNKFFGEITLKKGELSPLGTLDGKRGSNYWKNYVGMWDPRSSIRLLDKDELRLFNHEASKFLSSQTERQKAPPSQRKSTSQ